MIYIKTFDEFLNEDLNPNRGTNVDRTMTKKSANLFQHNFGTDIFTILDGIKKGWGTTACALFAPKIPKGLPDPVTGQVPRGKNATPNPMAQPVIVNGVECKRIYYIKVYHYQTGLSWEKVEAAEAAKNNSVYVPGQNKSGLMQVSGLENFLKYKQNPATGNTEYYLNIIYHATENNPNVQYIMWDDNANNGQGGYVPCEYKDVKPYMSATKEREDWKDALGNSTGSKVYDIRTPLISNIIAIKSKNTYYFNKECLANTPTEVANIIKEYLNTNGRV